VGAIDTSEGDPMRYASYRVVAATVAIVVWLASTPVDALACSCHHDPSRRFAQADVVFVGVPRETTEEDVPAVRALDVWKGPVRSGATLAVDLYPDCNYYLPGTPTMIYAARVPADAATGDVAYQALPCSAGPLFLYFGDLFTLWPGRLRLLATTSPLWLAAAWLLRIRWRRRLPVDARSPVPKDPVPS
jgi:hypothetical protein